MNKQESLAIKGIAILMMIYLHADVSDFLYLTRACGPVPFFLIVSGYGLSCNGSTLSRRIRSCFRVLCHYWFILTLFLILGCVMKPSLYYGGIPELINNYTAWKTSYNGEYWFLFPYLLLSLSSPWLIPIIRRFHSIVFILFASGLYIATLFAYHQWGLSYIYDHRWSEQLIWFSQFLLPFGLGVLAHEYQWFDKISKKIQSQILVLCLLVILVSIRCLVPDNYFDSFYSFFFISLFLSLNRSPKLDKTLSFFGRHSMNMWFIHSWFCYYLFRPYIYNIGNPLLIYLSIVFISLGLSICINYIMYCCNFVRNRKIRHKRASYDSQNHPLYLV